MTIIYTMTWAQKIRWKSQVNDKVSFKNKCGQIYTIYFYA